MGKLHLQFLFITEKGRKYKGHAAGRVVCRCRI